MSDLSVLLAFCRVGVKLFLLFMVASQFCPCNMSPSVLNILVFTRTVRCTSCVLTGSITNLRKVTGVLERWLLPSRPTTGMGSIRVPVLLTHWHSGTLYDPVVVSVTVSDMFSTVPVLRPCPAGALLSLSTSPLSLCRPHMPYLRSMGVTCLPTPIIVPAIFPLLQ